MAVWSAPGVKEVGSANRWDAEFFQPRFRSLERQLRAQCEKRLTDLASLSTTRFDPASVRDFQYVEISGIDLETGHASPSTVPASEAPDRAQYLLDGREVLVSTVRPNRACIALLPEEAHGWVASSGFAVLRPADDRSRSLLFVWLKTGLAVDWLDRHTTASMYPAVSVGDILAAPTPSVPDAVLHEVHKLVRTMETSARLAKTLYPEAEAEMLSRLGWQALRDSHKKAFYETNLGAISKAERADAEYFHPRARALEGRLLKLGARRIGDFCAEPTRGVQPAFDEHGSILALDSKSVRAEGIVDSGARVSRSFYDLQSTAGAQVKQGDVLLNSTGRGTLGRAGYYESSAAAICDNHVSILRPDTVTCHPRYLSLFLNSPAGLLQSERFQTGSSGQVEIYPDHIRRFLIFLPTNRDGILDTTWQTSIVEKLQAASDARRRAVESLRLAKQLLLDALPAVRTRT